MLKVRKLLPKFNRFFTQTKNQSSQLQNIKKNMMAEMIQTYPHIFQRSFNGQIAYTLQGISPEEMLKQGGLKVREKPRFIWLSNTGSGDNKGSICLSLLPEVTTIFSNDSKDIKNYIYAFPLMGNFLLPGGPWRQVISPGAFPLPPYWLAREVLKIDENRQVILGPMIGDSNLKSWKTDESFLKFFQNKLIKPEEIDVGSDYPMEYHIIDTPQTKAFQQEVKAYYDNIPTQSLMKTQ